MKNFIRSQKGIALPLVMVVLLVFSILGVSVASYVSRETKSADDNQNYLQGRYLAEAAVEEGIFQVKNSLNPTTPNLSLYDWTTNTFPINLNPVFYQSTGKTTGWETVDDANGDGKAYGKYQWYYVVPDGTLLSYLGLSGISNTYDPTDATQYTWVNYDGSNPTKGTTLPTNNGLYPNAISFSRILLGQAEVFPTNQSTAITRNILAVVNFTFYPAQTPTPVTVVVTKWQDYVGSISPSLLK